MPLHLICGPMFAGKTSLLMKILKERKPSETIIIKHKNDSRYTCTLAEIRSHNGEIILCNAFNSLDEVETTMPLEKITSIMIDEGQFFPDVDSKVIQWVASGKEVIITALPNGLFMEPIQNIANLMAIADNITLLSSQCTSCLKEAHFTYRTSPLPDNASPENPTALVGGKEAYTPLCRRCFLKRIQFEKKHSQGMFAGKGIDNFSIPESTISIKPNLNGEWYDWKTLKSNL